MNNACHLPEAKSEREKAPEPEQHKLGELLIGAKLLQPELLRKAIDISRTSGLPTGRTLIRLNVLDQRSVDSAVEIQSLIRENKITSANGVKALRKVAQSGMPVSEALQLFS